MAISLVYTPLNKTTDTFDDWLIRTNLLADDLTDLASVALTADATPEGAAVVGNSTLKGNLDVFVLSALTGIRGGTNIASAPLNITSDLKANLALTVVGATTTAGITNSGLLQNNGNLTVTGTSNLITTNVTGALTVTGATAFSGAVSSVNVITGSISGNAATATKLFAPVNVTLSGAIAATGTFDGSSNLSLVTTLDPNTDAATLGGLLPTKFVRSDIAATKVGDLTLSNGALTLTAGSLTLAAGSVNAPAGDMKSKTTTLTDGSNVWTFSMVTGTLSISYNGNKLFKLDSNGTLTVKGDIVAFGTV